MIDFACTKCQLDRPVAGCAMIAIMGFLVRSLPTLTC
jgi:hypothetical protein